MCVNEQDAEGHLNNGESWAIHPGQLSEGNGHVLVHLTAANHMSNPAPNPSVKGTSTSGLRPLAAAPYLER
jgi:hypothetical protein